MVQEELFDMIDREVDGSDSLEVGNFHGFNNVCDTQRLRPAGFYAVALDRGRHRIRAWQLSP